MAQQKTYWHLLQQRRMPNEYEIVTSKLHSYTGEGFTGKRFELDVPLTQWYKQYQEDSPLTCSSWEKFSDPRETIYTTYTDLQRTKEIFVDGLLEEIDTTGYNSGLSAAWMRILERTVAPFRYPSHGLQMIAAYVGQMGPSGRITIVGAMQAADEMRRVQRIAYRVRQLQLVHPGFAENSKTLWQNDPLWQPLREAIEKLLVTYDWGESFVGLNLVLKPLVDELFMKHLGDLGRQEGDYMLGQIFYSLNEDCQWHRQWSQALVTMAIKDTPRNQEVIQGWVNKWYPVAARAVQAFAPVFDEMPGQAKTLWLKDVVQRLEEYYGEYLGTLGLQRPASYELVV
jgi:toluene monooxygenase system protein E